jgi:hypothetical protein
MSEQPLFVGEDIITDLRHSLRRRWQSSVVTDTADSRGNGLSSPESPPANVRLREMVVGQLTAGLEHHRRDARCAK